VKVAGSYGQKYAKGKKPACFGDVEEYDLRDRVCRDCGWKRSCKSVVESKLEREEEEDEEEKKDGRRIPNPEDFVEREDSGDLGFFSALAINSGLYAVGVALGEAQYAVGQIPRFRYEDPFASAIARGKKRAKKETDT
jgi:hypothetical protein